MLVLYIILALLFCLFLLSLANIYVDIKYDDELALCLKVLFVKVRILPPQPKKKKSDKAKKSKKKKGKKKKKEKPEKEEKSISPRDFFKEKGVSGIINIIKQIASLATGAMKDLFSRIVIKNLSLNLKIAGEDAADTAVKYGKCCSAVFPCISAILRIVRCEKYSVNIEPDFSDNPQTEVSASALARIRIINLIIFAFLNLYKMIKLYINLKSKEKK